MRGGGAPGTGLSAQLPPGYISRPTRRSTKGKLGTFRDTSEIPNRSTWSTRGKAKHRAEPTLDIVANLLTI